MAIIILYPHNLVLMATMPKATVCNGYRQVKVKAGALGPFPNQDQGQGKEIAGGESDVCVCVCVHLKI